ncbi:MAG: hypothetical protein AB7D57_01610 [Desulfovibrionaceae bacterium]
MRIPVLSAAPAAFVLVLLCVPMLSGCGQDDDAGRPADVARAAFERSLAMDVDGLLEVSCTKLKGEIESSREEVKLMTEMMGSMGVRPKDIQFDFSGLTFEVLEQKPDSAMVHITGDMVMNAPGLGQDVQTQDETVRLVREGGAWKYCSELH